MSDIDKLADGSLGYFWTDLGDELDIETALSGYVRRRDDNLFHVSSLTTHLQLDRMMAGGAEQMQVPASVFGMTNVAGALFFDSAGVSQSNILGATRASTETYRARGVVTGLSLDECLSDKFEKVTLAFPGVLSWSGLKTLSEDVDTVDGKPVAYQAKIRKSVNLDVPLGRRMKLSVSSTWNVEGPYDERVISTPLIVTTESHSPQHWADHLKPLSSVQDVLNIAYQGFVVAGSGSAKINLKESKRLKSASKFWNSRFMTVPKGIDAHKGSTFPVFNIGDLGGVEGLRRWIELDRDHPRATGPLVNLYRYGAAGVEVSLIELAAAIEYWTAAHRSLGRAWASPLRRGETLPNALVRKVGPDFENFVGDGAKWADLFWRTYNNLKHAPNWKYDPYEIGLLARSAAVLLQCALLARCRGNRQVVKVVCESHRNYNLGTEISDLVDNSRP